MMIQFFLTALLAGVAAIVMIQRTTSNAVRLAILVIVAGGGLFVWIPDQTTVIAEAIGVGRGADLILYLWVVITLAVILLLYLQIIAVTRRVTRLTRALALANAKPPAVGRQIPPG